MLRHDHPKYEFGQHVGEIAITAELLEPALGALLEVMDASFGGLDVAMLAQNTSRHQANRRSCVDPRQLPMYVHQSAEHN